MPQWTRTTATALRIQRQRALESARDLVLSAIPDRQPLLTSGKSVDKVARNHIRRNYQYPQRSGPCEREWTAPTELLQQLRILSHKSNPQLEEPTAKQAYTSITDELQRLAMAQGPVSKEKDRGQNKNEAPYHLRNLIDGGSSYTWQPIRITINSQTEPMKPVTSIGPLRPRPLDEAFESPDVYRACISSLLPDAETILVNKPSPAPLRSHSGEKQKLNVIKSASSAPKDAADQDKTSHIFLSLLK